MGSGTNHVSRALSRMTSAQAVPDSGYTAGPMIGYVSGSSAALTGLQLRLNPIVWGVGASFGELTAHDTGYLNARSDVDGYWIGTNSWLSIGQLFGQPRLAPLHLGVGVQYGWFAADIKRRYLNVSAIDTTVSDTDLATLNAGITLDWRTRLSSSVALVPYVQALHSRYHADPYRERRAAFAGSVGGQRDDAMEYSFGAAIEKQVRHSTALMLRYGLHILNDKRGPGVTIDVAHAGSFGVRDTATIIYGSRSNRAGRGRCRSVHLSSSVPAYQMAAITPKIGLPAWD